jgi:hypothetical protein
MRGFTFAFGGGLRTLASVFQTAEIWVKEPDDMIGN